MRPRWLLLLLVCCAPLAAQITQLAPQCPGVSQAPGGLHSLLVLSNPLAGSSLELWTQTAIQPQSGCPSVPVLRVMLIGFQNPSVPFSSCGCVLRASPDIIEAIVAPWTLTPGFCGTTTTRSVALPSNAAGLSLYVQSFALMPPAAAAPGLCIDFGFPFLTSQSYRVTVQ